MIELSRDGKTYHSIEKKLLTAENFNRCGNPYSGWCWRTYKYSSRTGQRIYIGKSAAWWPFGHYHAYTRKYWEKKAKDKISADKRSKKKAQDSQTRRTRMNALADRGIRIKPVWERIKNIEMDHLLDDLEKNLP